MKIRSWLVGILLLLLTAVGLGILFGADANLTPAIGTTERTLVLLCVAAHPDDEDGATLAYY